MGHYVRRRSTPALSIALLTALAAFAAILVGSSSAAPAVAPNNVGEPTISGTPRVGQVLRSTRGTWTGTSADLPTTIAGSAVRDAAGSGRVRL